MQVFDMDKTTTYQQQSNAVIERMIEKLQIMVEI